MRLWLAIKALFAQCNDKRLTMGHSHFLSTPEQYFALFFFTIVWYGFNPFSANSSDAGDPSRRVVFYRAVRDRLPGPMLFAVVWFLLYGILAVSQYLTYRDLGDLSHANRAWILALTLLNLLLNKAWYPVFFERRAPGAALAIVIATLITAVIWMIVVLVAGQTTAGLLLIPYVLWLIIATVLNWKFWNTWSDDETAVAARNESTAKLAPQPGIRF